MQMGTTLSDHILPCVDSGGVMYKINASTTTNKSYIVQTLSVRVATYYCIYKVADHYARWIGMLKGLPVTLAAYHV